MIGAGIETKLILYQPDILHTVKSKLNLSERILTHILFTYIHLTAAECPIH